MTNTLAYCGTFLITIVKSLMLHAPAHFFTKNEIIEGRSRTNKTLFLPKNGFKVAPSILLEKEN
jgi:hypothetical protein